MFELVKPHGKIASDFRRLRAAITHPFHRAAVRKAQNDNPHLTHLVEPDKSVRACGEVTALLVALLLLYPYLIYLQIYYTTKVCKYLWLTRSDEKTRTALALTALAAVVSVTALGAGAAMLLAPLSSLGSGAGYLVAALNVASLTLISCFVATRIKQTAWVTASDQTHALPAAANGKLLPRPKGFDPLRALIATNPFRDDEPGERQTIAFGVVDQTPLQVDVAQHGGAIVPKLHHDPLAPKPGDLLVQDWRDLLLSTSISGATGTGKTQSFLLPFLDYAATLSQTMGTGALIFDLVAGYDPTKKQFGSLFLEKNCHKVMALDKGAQSARFNILRAGGRALADSLYSRDSEDDAAGTTYYLETAKRYLMAVTDVALAVEAVVKPYWTPEGWKNLDHLTGGVPLAQEVAHPSVEGLIEIFRASEKGVGLINSITKVMTLRVAGADSPYLIGPDKIQNSMRGDWVHFAAIVTRDNSKRKDFLDKTSNLLNKLTEIAYTYGDLLHDHDCPEQQVIRVQDAIDKNTLIGVRLSSNEGDARKAIARCLFSIYKDCVLSTQRQGLQSLLIVDEFPVIAGSDPGGKFADFFAQSRARGAASIVAWQHVGQLFQADKLRLAIKNNVRNQWVVLPAIEDANYLSETLGEEEVATVAVNQTMEPAQPNNRNVASKIWKPKRHEHGTYNVSERIEPKRRYEPNFLKHTEFKAVFSGRSQGRQLDAVLVDLERGRLKAALAGGVR